MLISGRWLIECLSEPLELEKIAPTLTSLGAETKIVSDRRDWYEKIVIGSVESVDALADRGFDRLNLLRIDVGSDRALSIVCADRDVKTGDFIPVAIEGARLPDGTRIEARELAGVRSEGMALSEEELMISADGGKVLRLDDPDLEAGEFFRARYGETLDLILDVDITPNRGDMACAIGLARELAAKTKMELKLPAVDFIESGAPIAERVDVRIDSADLCHRYIARLIDGIEIGPSPFWMRRRLGASGFGAINNVVDVTNYALLEMGNPLHAFDFDKIADGTIIARRARAGEKLVALDGSKLDLSADHLVIADASRPLALAGVMGGVDSAITSESRSALLEAAAFDPGAIRRASRALGISSESSYRFERGVSALTLESAIDRAASLIAGSARGSIAKGSIDRYPTEARRESIELRFDRIERIIGASIPSGGALDILTRLGVKIEGDSDRSRSAIAPAWRFDLDREIDLIEEIARHYGYDQIEPAIASSPPNLYRFPPTLAMRRKAREHLRSIGMSEAMSFSFVNPASARAVGLDDETIAKRLIAIDNPMNAQWTHLRCDLSVELIKAASRAEFASLFELGVVHFRDERGARRENFSLAGVMTEQIEPDLWRAPDRRDYYDLLGAVESSLDALGLHRREFKAAEDRLFYLRRQSSIEIDRTKVGRLGQVHPRALEKFKIDQEIFYFELNLDALSAIEPDRVEAFRAPRYPSVKRALALIVDESIPAGEIEDSIRSIAGARLSSIRLFDLFRGGGLKEVGEKSLAFALEFRDESRTLIDSEIDAMIETILDTLRSRHGARLRSAPSS